MDEMDGIYHIERRGRPATWWNSKGLKYFAYTLFFLIVAIIGGLIAWLLSI
jgi:hypothetical protein